VQAFGDLGRERRGLRWGPWNPEGPDRRGPGCRRVADGALGATYTSTGGHTHQVTVSQAELQTLASTCAVTTNNNTGHSHTWTITIPT
jgi:hypothetical protein